MKREHAERNLPRINVLDRDCDRGHVDDRGRSRAKIRVQTSRSLCLDPAGL